VACGVTWAFIWLMLLLKIPIGWLLWIVWWTIHQTDGQTTSDEGDGGSKVHGYRVPLPRPPRPEPRPRRGARHVLPPPAPSRTRCVAAKIRTLDCPATNRARQCFPCSSRPSAAVAPSGEGS
jgi:hypothetical protein